jgi:hypothetical protein
MKEVYRLGTEIMRKRKRSFRTPHGNRKIRRALLIKDKDNEKDRYESKDHIRKRIGIKR